MSDSDEDMEYENQVEELISVFDNIFRTATADPTNLSRDIFSVVEAHPTCACAHALAYTLSSNSETSPKDIYTFVRGTAAVFASYSEANNIFIDEPDTSSGSRPTPFHTELYVTLADIIGYGLGDNEHDKGLEISPSNVTLQTALFSGSVVATGLMKDSSISMSFVREGLRLSNRATAERHELLAITACLQLVTAGAPMVTQRLETDVSLDDVVHALEKLKEDNVIRHPGGVRLLETTIALAKNKFAESMSPAESWTFLFSNGAPPVDSPGDHPDSNAGSKVIPDVSLKDHPPHKSKSGPNCNGPDRACGVQNLFINTAPRRYVHSMTSVSGSLLAFPPTHHRPMISPVHRLPTHYAQSTSSAGDKHIHMCLRQHFPGVRARSSLRIGGSGLSGREIMRTKIFRFIL